MKSAAVFVVKRMSGCKTAMNTLHPRDLNFFTRYLVFKRSVCWALLGIGIALNLAVWKFYRPTVDESLTPQIVVSSQLESGPEFPGITSENAGMIASMKEANDRNSTGNRITAGISQATFETAKHPLVPLLEIADQALVEIEKNVNDYSATLTSQVFYEGKLREEKCLFCKIRHARVLPDGKKIPFSAYIRFLKPQPLVGQEAIWVDGWHQGNLVAHIGGWGNVMRFYIDPDGSLAMEGNRHPIRDIGMRNLIVKMQEVGRRDREQQPCQVNIRRHLQINDRPCTLLEIIHPEQQPHFEFHIARIYLDDERSIPIAYEGFLWPEIKGGSPRLLEKYYYTDIKLNIGLQDLDFDPANQEYNYPAR